MTQTPILSVSNLTTSFWVDGLWKPVVRSVSFEIAPKETLAVVGESGSGKSVTALSIMRLTPSGNSKIEGSIKLSGQELLTLPDPDMRKIRGNDVAMIFQEPMTSLNPVSNDEIKSPVRPADYIPPIRQFREVSPGHAVMIWGKEWEKKAIEAAPQQAA